MQNLEENVLGPHDFFHVECVMMSCSLYGFLGYFCFIFSSCEKGLFEINICIYGVIKLTLQQEKKKWKKKIERNWAPNIGKDLNKKSINHTK